MTPASGSTHGRLAVLLALGVLGATVGATLYVILAQSHPNALPASTTSATSAPSVTIDEGRRAATFLLIVSISVLLALMAALGAYVVIRYGQRLARQKVGGQPTEYVDAWGHYRLSDEEISAATAEDPTEGEEGSDGSSEPPDQPPPGSPSTGS